MEQVDIQPSTDIELNRHFEVKIGQEVVLSTESLKIKFDSVTKDSRCPIEVKCFWQGEAELLVHVSKPNQVYNTIKFNSTFSTEQKFLNYRIKLSSLKPEKHKNIKAEEYVVTLVVTKDDKE